MNHQSQRFFQKASELHAKQTPFAVVTLLHTRGHAPQDQGAKAIVGIDGLIEGTVGGGRVEARAIEYCREFLKGTDTSPRMETWNLQKDIGMSCGGEVTFLFEVFKPSPWKIAVFGAGHVAQKLIPLLSTLNCQVFCIDNRPEWMDRLTDFSNLTKIVINPMEEALSQIPQDSFLMLMTQGHKTDLPILKKILETRKPPYLGVIGSPIKGLTMRKDLKALGFTEDQVRDIFCPMGLELGNNDPAEIAISMAAQILQHRDHLLSFSEIKTKTEESKLPDINL